MIRRLPRWAFAVGSLLAALAGMVNVIGLLGFAHEAVTHLTGTTVLLGAALSGADWALARVLLLVALAFALGALLAGLLTAAAPLQLDRRHAFALLLEAGLLAAGAWVFARLPLAGITAAALACGLQNGVSTTFSGGVLRTTHLTGSYTDLGVGLGRALRGTPPPPRLLALHAAIIAGFLAGAAGGGLLYQWLDTGALWLPALFAAGLALGLFLHLHHRRRHGHAHRPG